MPSIVAMTAASLYNILDSVFIGHGVGHLGIAALAICFPFMNLTAAFGAMVGVGATTVASLKMGQQDYKGAESVLGNVVLLDIMISLSLTVVCLVFLDPILYFFGASEATLPYAREYMRIILAANVINHTFRGLSDMMRASGYPQKSMYLTLLSVGINAVLGYLFVLVFNWGIAGAAWATVIAWLSSVFYLYAASQKCYYIPYRSLIPKGVKNLLVAGRCISSTHEAQSAYRVLPIVCCIGEGAGTAAALACRDGADVRDVCVEELHRLLDQHGAKYC